MVTFVLRLQGRRYEPGTDAELRAEPHDEELRGLVEHVPSGRRLIFRAADELLAFLRTAQE